MGRRACAQIGNLPVSSNSSGLGRMSPKVQRASEVGAARKPGGASQACSRSKDTSPIAVQGGDGGELGNGIFEHCSSQGGSSCSPPPAGQGGLSEIHASGRKSSKQELREGGDAAVQDETFGGVEDESCRVGASLMDGMGCSEEKRSSESNEESFQDRALRFEAEDWDLLADRWAAGTDRKVRKDDNKPSDGPRISHSPSASECSSSLFSTLDSTSSFSSRSEASSYGVKGDISPASVIPTHAQRLPMAVISLPPPSIPQSYHQALHKVSVAGDSLGPLDLKLPTLLKGPEDVSFLEFDFREGRMVESQDRAVLGAVGDDNTFECPGIRSEEMDVCIGRQMAGPGGGMKLQSLPSYRNLELSKAGDDSEAAASGFATPLSVFFSATTRSPESVFCSPEQRFYFSSFDGDVSGSLNGHDEEWDVSRYDSDPCVSDKCRFGSNKAEDFSLPSSQGRPAHALVPSHFGKPPRAARKGLPVKNVTTSRPPSSPRGGRSLLGKRLPSPHKATESPLTSGASSPASKVAGQGESKRFNASSAGGRRSPSPLSARSYGSPGSRAGTGERVSSAPVLRTSSSPSLRTATPSPAKRNFYSSFKDSKLSHAIHDSMHTGLRGPKTEIPQQCGRASSSPIRSWMDPVKESRASILASWASVYGAATQVPVKTSPESVTDSEREVCDPLKGSRMRASLKRKGSLASLYRAASPGLPRRISKTFSSSSSDEAVCRALVPALKTPSCLPAPKFSSISVKSAHSLSQRVHSFVSRSPGSLIAFEGGPCAGQLQCVYRDGLPSYSLVMLDTEEMFVAKTCRTVPADGSTDQLFSIYRWKGKATRKSGWRSWGKKDKPVCEFVGKLRVSSTLCDELSVAGDVKYYVESECVFLDVLDPEAIALTSFPSSAKLVGSGGGPRDRTPGRTPWLQGDKSPASSAYFSPASSSILGSPSADLLDGSSRYVSYSMPERYWASPYLVSKPKEAGGPDKFPWHVGKSMYRSSPGKLLENRARKSFQDFWSDSEGTDDSELNTRTSIASQFQTELAAVLIRTPVEKDLAFLQGANLAPGEKTGWGLNFLKRRSIRPARSASVTADESLGCTTGSPPDSDGGSDCGHCSACGSDAPEATLQKSRSNSSSCSGSERGHRRKLCDLQKMEDNISEHGKISAGRLEVTLVLPAGRHGFSSAGACGPQPLLQRWKSGGKCDCGNWDEGCGLKVLESQAPSMDPLFGDSQQQSCRIFPLGKEMQAAMHLSQQEHDGLFSVSFQHPISSVQGFVTAVAILRCREPFLPVSKKSGDVKKKPPRAPARPPVMSTRSRVNSRSHEDVTLENPFGLYRAHCPPDPPLSPCARS